MGLFEVITVTALLIVCAQSIIVPIIDDKLEICVEPEERASKFDLTNFHLVIEEDTKVFLNGSVTMINELKRPWKAEFFLERFDRGQWNIQGMYKKFPDLCEELVSKTNYLMPWYKYISKMQHNKCPFPAGAVETFDMVSLEDIPVVFPPSYEGKWRMTFRGWFEDEDDKQDCGRVLFDLVDL